MRTIKIKVLTQIHKGHKKLQIRTVSSVYTPLLVTYLNIFLLVKFLLAAGEADSPGKSMKIPALNKRLNASLNQEALEKLYERLLKIINLPMDEYLDNEEYVREIDTYDQKSIQAAEDREARPKEEGIKNKEEKGAIDVNETGEERKTGMEVEENGGGGDQDDLICDEVQGYLGGVLLRICEQEVEELGGPKEKGIASQSSEEKKMTVESGDKEGEKGETDKEAEEKRKLSLYKIKKNRIIREFISVLRELDT